MCGCSSAVLLADVAVAGCMVGSKSASSCCLSSALGLLVALVDLAVLAESERIFQVLANFVGDCERPYNVGKAVTVGWHGQMSFMNC